MDLAKQPWNFKLLFFVGYFFRRGSSIVHRSKNFWWQDFYDWSSKNFHQNLWKWTANFRSSSTTERVVIRTSKVIITNFFMLDPIKSRRRYFFTLVAYEFSFFSFLSCCLSCVCFWHLFWQFSLGEKGLSAWEISISTKSCQTWAALECSKAIPPPSFVKLEFQFDEFLLMFFSTLCLLLD